jgi:DNA-binding NarL/FixJ family response regulator
MTLPGTDATAGRVRIALCDDQALVLRGLSALLGDLGIEIAVESTDAARLLDALALRPVDVVVSDIRMPGMDGIALLGALRERGDSTPVILLTTFDDEDLMLRAVEAGAQGFLLKDASPEDLRDAIVRVAGGQTMLQPVSLGPVRAAWQARRAARCA